MKNKTTLLLTSLTCILFASCASMRAPVITQNEPLTGYKYFYVTPTSELSSSAGMVYGNKYGSYGTSESKNINPSDVISGVMIKNGFIRIPELKDDVLDQTLIVNYGESGRRNVNLGYSIEVTIQMLSAKTDAVVCICTAEGQGTTEVDDVRIAINRALEGLFK